MTERLRIAVTGLAATYPFGGVFFDYLQYVAGLRRLGHDVLYIEDTGKWCYDPTAETFVEDGSANARYLAREIVNMADDLEDAWFFRDARGTTYGRSWADVVRFCGSADLFLHVSASCWMREEYFAARRVAFVDSDPMFTQASVPGYVDGTLDAEERDRVDMLRAHDVFFTFGEAIGSPACRVPTALFDWKPTRQPVVLDLFAGHAVPVPERRRVLTTVASWESAEGGRVVDGVRYEGKGAGFLPYMDLPSRSAVPLELALAGRAPVDALRSHGWRLRDPLEVSRHPASYRDYLARSLGEWSVAKHAYVAGRTGWFSCRSACYLALGVPVVVQDTGFSAAIPAGEGVLAFSTPDEAADAIRQVADEPERHAKAARAIAEECFDSRHVLTKLIEEAMA
jgi:hypothetical protein